MVHTSLCVFRWQLWNNKRQKKHIQINHVLSQSKGVQAAAALNSIFYTKRLGLSALQLNTHYNSCYIISVMDMSPFYITRPNTTQPMMLSQGSNPTHPPLDSNPSKGDIFPLNVANSKIQNRPRSYIGYNIWRMPPTNSYKTVPSHNHSHNSPARGWACPTQPNPTQIIYKNFDPTQPMDGPDPCPSLHYIGA